jgi:hypothetical protein
MLEVGGTNGILGRIDSLAGRGCLDETDLVGCFDAIL